MRTSLLAVLLAALLGGAAFAAEANSVEEAATQPQPAVSQPPVSRPAAQPAILAPQAAPQPMVQHDGVPAQNAGILIDYQPPPDPAMVFNVDPSDSSAEVKKAFATYKRFMAIYQRLRDRQVLERYAQFLAAMKLPMTLRLISRQCGEVNAYFSPKEVSINLCYELLAHFEDDLPKGDAIEGITADDALIGGVTGVLLHETGHAMFFLYHIPVLGREEDAADQIAAYVMLQFGDEVALTTVKGMLWAWHDWSSNDFTDVHSTPIQRFNTFLCIGYGGKPKLFQHYIDKKYLMLYKPEDCRREYDQVQKAFVKTVLPHVDPAIMKQVQSATWFRPQDKIVIPVQTR